MSDYVPAPNAKYDKGATDLVGYRNTGHRYIFFRQIVGTDAAPVALAAVHDPQITLEGLPAGATVKISVQSANAAGKSALTGPVEIKL